MTKQALNHLLGQLERLAYVERRSEPGSRQSTVYYTERGWKVIEVTLAAMRQLEHDWIGKIGPNRFGDFKTTMKELTGILPTEPGLELPLPVAAEAKKTRS